MRVGYVQWPEGLVASGPAWNRLTDLVKAASPDLLLTNELPFGPWIASLPEYMPGIADISIAEHQRGAEALARLDVSAIVSTRPVLDDGQLFNEAFVIADGQTHPLHRKQVFPNEPGWFEETWYDAGAEGFAVSDILGIKVGMLICSEAMYPEIARTYGRQGADLILLPRATGRDILQWKTAGAMAAIVSGAYVVSSNRFGFSDVSPHFGGGGYAYAPGGKLLGATNNSDLIRTIDIDLVQVKKARAAYPCYMAGSLMTG